MSQWPALHVLPPGARDPRPGDAPTVSVVIASARERASLEACLAALLPQCRRHGAELVVARAAEPAELGALAAAYPEVLFVGALQTSTIPQLRVAGLGAAEGDIVAFTEDHGVVAADWLAQMLPTQKAAAGRGSATADKVQREHASSDSPPTVSI